MHDPADDPTHRNLPLRVTGWALILAVLALAASMIVPTLLGYGRYVLVSGSMTGTYDTGSVVYTRDQPVSTLRVGQVITYAPPPGSSPQTLVTHRIVSRSEADGRLVLRTKGDANQSVDPWTFTLKDREQAVVRFGVPRVGYLISAFADPGTRRLVIGVPAVLIALLAVLGLLRDAAREAREARDGGSTADGGEATPDDGTGTGGDASAPGAGDGTVGPSGGRDREPTAVAPHTVFPPEHRAGLLTR